MAWTEPSVAKEFITASILDHPGLLQRVTTYEDRNAGAKITVPVMALPTVASANVDAIQASSRNDTILTLTAADYSARTALKKSEYDAFLNDPSMQAALLQKHAEAHAIQMEDGLDTLLKTSSNTISLATDYTYTLAKFNEGLANIFERGGDMSGTTMVTNTTGFSTMVTAGYANAGGRAGVGDITGNIGLINGQVPVYVSAQFTGAAGTGGQAGYLFHRRGVVLAMGGVEVMGPAPSIATGSWDIVTLSYYAFSFTEGAAGKLVVRYNNP